MIRRISLVATISIIAVLSAADPPKDDPTAKVRKQFYRCWLETEEVKDGVRVTDPEKLGASEFTLEYNAGWGRRGELSQGIQKPGPRIDPTADPMRLDFRSEGRSRSFGGDKGDEIVPILQPCVFKLEGDNLVIVYSGKWVVEKEFKKGEDYAERPKEFKSTKENKLTVTTMKPCGKWDQD